MNIFTLGLVATTLLAQHVGFVDVDPLEFAAACESEAALRWDNVEGTMHWLGGEFPVKNRTDKMHTVQLRPGEGMLLLLPASEMLRVLSQREPFSEGSLEFWISNGSGVFIEAHAVQGEDGRNLLLQPEWADPLLVDVRRPLAKEPIELAFFVSRRERANGPDPYRTQVSTPLPHVRVRDLQDNTLELYSKLSQPLAIRLQVKKASQLVIKSMLDYGPQDTSRRRHYRLFAAVDDAPPIVFDQEAAPRVRASLRVDDELRVIGTACTAFLALSPGDHTFHLDSSAPIFYRMALHEETDYLFPALNAPDPPPQNPALFAPNALGLWGIPREALLQQANPLDEMLVLAALRLARDNRNRDGGMAAAMLVRGASLRYPAYAPLQRLYKGIIGSHTFSRDLFPTTEFQPCGYQYYLEENLVEPSPRQFAQVVGKQHLEELLSFVPRGYFVQPVAEKNVLNFSLPRHFTPTILRCAVDLGASSQESGFEIHWNGNSRKVVIRPELRPPRDYYEPALGTMALESLASVHGEEALSTLSGAFALTQEPAPLVQAGTVEFFLPAEVTDIQISALGSDIPLPRIALSYRASKVFALSEEEYFAGLPPDALAEGLFDEFVSVLHDPPDSVSSSVYQLDRYNHWLPLIRFIESRHTLFKSFASASRNWTGDGTSSAPPEGFARARDMAASGEELLALEALGFVQNAGPEARMLQIRLLDQLGETYLSELFARGEVIYGQDANTRTAAFEYLAERYRNQNDDDMLLALQSFAFYREPSTDGLQALMNSLLRTSDYNYALWIALILPEEARPLGGAVRAAYVAGWWRTFDLWSTKLPEQDRLQWQFMRGQRLTPAELPEMSNALLAGAMLAEAKSIQQALRAPEVPLAGLAEKWSEWQAVSAGERRWMEVPELVVETEGAETIYNIPRDIHFRMFRAKPQEPLVLKVAGPAVLRLELRPLLTKEMKEIELDWLNIEYDGLPHLFSLLNYTPADGLRIEGNPSECLARAFQQELVLGAGLHTIRMSCRESNALVRVYAALPEAPFAALPRLTPVTLTAEHPDLPTPPLSNQHPTLDARKLYLLPNQDLAMLLVPLHLWMPEHYICSSDSGSGGRILHGLAAAAPSSPELLSEQETHVAKLAAAGKYSDLIEMPAPDDVWAIRAYMDQLLWIFETEPDLADAAVVRAAALAHDHPEVVELRANFDRMQRSLVWANLETVQESAGVRGVPLIGWQPESPDLRVRKTLLPPLGGEEFLLYDYGALLLSTSNSAAMRLEVEVELDVVQFVNQLPLHLLHQLDGEGAEPLTLSPENPKAQFILQVPPGNHQVRMAIIERAVNHFVRIRMCEVAGGSKTPILSDLERQYFVATPQEPVVVAVVGPAWLRIEQISAGQAKTEYQLFKAGVHYPKFAPNSGESLYRFSTLLTGDKEPPPERSDMVVTYAPVLAPEEKLEMPPTHERPAFDDVHALGKQEDGVWIASAAIEQRRNVQEAPNLEDSPERFMETSLQHLYWDEPNNVWFDTELLARQRLTGGPSYGIRERITWAPRQKPWIAELQGSAYLQEMDRFGSSPREGSLQLRGSLSWRRELAPKAYHVPEVSLTARWLSMDDNRNPVADDRLLWVDVAERALIRARTNLLSPEDQVLAGQLIHSGADYLRNRIPINRYPSEAIDRDIFSPHKAEHLLSLQLQDTVYYRPWLDTYLYAGAGLGTNERLWSIDNASARLGLRVLLRHLEAGAQYRYTRYFADDDRTVSLERHLAEISLRWERPLRNGNRMQAHLTLQNSMDGSAPDVRAGISYVFGAGRDYRDEAPGTRFFRDLRERQLYEEWNSNAIHDTTP